MDGHRARRRGWTRAALASALCLACGDGDATGSQVMLRVLERAGGAGAAVPLKLGTETRNALRVPARHVFRVPLAPGVRELLFSTAALEGAPALEFSVEVASGAGGEELFRSSAAPAEPAWRDHRVELEEDVTALRFRTHSASEDRAEAAAWGSILALGPTAPAPQLPHVILISLDTLGAAQLGAFGGAQGVSPNLDAWLGRAFSFRRAYAQYGNTLVSHASLFTGLQPVRHGVYPHLPPRPFDSLVGTLARHGFLVAGFTEGAFVSSNYGFSRGFDHYDDGILGIENQMRGGAPETFSRALAWLEEHAPRARCFLFVHTYAVHAPYLPRRPEGRAFADALTPGDARQLPREIQSRAILRHNAGEQALAERDLARLAALHAGEIHDLDAVLGDFFAGLAERGLADDTVVVLTSDHGDQFGEHGKVAHAESLHNRVLHVPLGFRWEGRIPPGQSDAPTQLVDVLPTILDLVGLETPGAVDGRSLAPLLRGQVPALPPRPALSEQRSARGECLRLGLPRECVLNRFAVQTERFKWIRSDRPRYERLYDLREDPLEERDVADRHPEELARHRALLRDSLVAAQQGGDGGGTLPTPDASTRERLRRLGYLD